MAQGMSLDISRCVVLLLSFSLLVLPSNGVPISRSRNLVIMDGSSVVDHQVVSGNRDSVDDIEKMGGRLVYLEVNDYPGYGANNRHTPKGHG